MIKTVIFTTTDIIKRARKYSREHKDAWGINQMNPQDFQEFSEELNQLASKFFNLAKATEHPEQEFLGMALRSSYSYNDKPKKVACLLLHLAAQSIIEDKVKELNVCLTRSSFIHYEAFDWWRAYESVRANGKYNMITQAHDAANEAGLTLDQFYYVIDNYNSLKASVIMEDALSEPAPF